MRALRVALALAALWVGAAGAADAPGEAARLGAVEWAGNPGLPATTLADSTGWRPGRRLDGAAWTALADGVARAYAAIGHLAAAVADVSLTDTPAGVRARVTVDEGPQHRFGEIEILGARSLPGDEARRLLDAPAGEPFASARLERGVGRLLGRYDDLGRPFTQVRLRRVTLRGDRVDAQVDVVESDSVVVESVAVDGPHRTGARVIGRALRGIEGAPYRSDLGEAGRSRLLDLGVFASVGEPRFQLTAPGRGELHYAVAEAAGSSFDGILGYQGQDNSVSGLAHLTLDNIAGTARQADAFWQGRGAGRSEFRFRYREPFVLGTRVSAGLGFSHELEDTLYARTEYGFEAGLPLGEGAGLGLGLEGGRVVASFGPVSETSWQGTRVSLRRRSRGWSDGAPLVDLFGYSAVLVTSQRFTREELRGGGGRRGDLLTLTLDAAAERRVGERRFVTLGLVGRYRDGDRDALPLYDLFPLGGAASLRGYREDEFRAARYLLLRADHGWGRTGTRVYFFLDQAVFYRQPEPSLSTGEAAAGYRAGYGFGASLPSGLGRVGLEFAWGRGDGPLDAKLHLRLRSRF